MLALKICLISVVLFFVFRFCARATLTDIDKIALKHTGSVHNITPMVFLLLGLVCKIVGVISGIWAIALLL